MLIMLAVMYFLSLAFMLSRALASPLPTVTTEATPTPTATELVRHEILTGIPTGWKIADLPYPKQPLTLQIFLQHDADEIQRVAQHVSDPSSPLYAEHLSTEELAAVQPKIDHYATKVRYWLRANDITILREDADSLTFITTVEMAEGLLRTRFCWFSHYGETPVLRTLYYSVPDDFEHVIDFVYPTVHFLTPALPGSSSPKQQRLPDTGLKT